MTKSFLFHSIRFRVKQRGVMLLFCELFREQVIAIFT